MSLETTSQPDNEFPEEMSGSASEQLMAMAYDICQQERGAGLPSEMDQSFNWPEDPVHPDKPKPLLKMHVELDNASASNDPRIKEVRFFSDVNTDEECQLNLEASNLPPGDRFITYMRDKFANYPLHDHELCEQSLIARNERLQKAAYLHEKYKHNPYVTIPANRPPIEWTE
jgi:hypothetical protein